MERFLDGDLGQEQADILADQIRSSPDLGRLSHRVRESDDLIRAALLSTPDRAARIASPLRLAWRIGGLATASLALVAMAVLTIRWSGTPATPIETTPIASRTDHPVPEVLEKITANRVVFSVPLRKPGNATPDTPRGREMAPQRHARTIDVSQPRPPSKAAAFVAAVHRKDFPAATTLARDAGPEQRETMFTRLGSTMFSSSSARVVLEAFPPDVAIELCGTWLRDGTQRPVAMRRLDHLASEPASRGYVRGMLVELLASRPDLRPWMSSYTNWLFASHPASDGGERGAWGHPPDQPGRQAGSQPGHRHTVNLPLAHVG